MPRVISALGLVVILGLAWSLSSHRRHVRFRTIWTGLALQFGLAAFVLLTPWGRGLFEQAGALITTLLTFVEAGSDFVFALHPRPDDPPLPPQAALLRTFAFGVLPTVIFFSSLMSVLYYLGVMQLVLRAMAGIMRRTMNLSAAESLAAAANVFVGHTEAPLVIRPYIPGMTRSELNALMVGGFATITGGLLAVFAGMGIDPGHLLTASVISAPAALVIAKILQPELETPQTLGGVQVEIPRQGVNVIEAAAIGASEGLKLALNIGAMLIAFLALIAMCDALLGWLGLQLGFATADGRAAWSLAGLLGYVFWPLAWIMGVEAQDCLQAGQLLGLKTVANEVLAYDQLSRWMQADTANPLSARTVTIMTYALAGFSNLGAIGIQIGGIGGLAPNRRGDLAELGLRAMAGGGLACCMTGCIAGVLT